MSELSSILEEVGLVAPGDPELSLSDSHNLLSDSAAFRPVAPRSLKDIPVPADMIEALVLKFILNRGTVTGREIAEQIGLPFRVASEHLRDLKTQQLVGHRKAAGMNDYLFELTNEGHERARRHLAVTSYFGAVPVTLKEYEKSIEAQSLQTQKPTPEDLAKSLADLTLNPKMMSQIGQAVRAARAMFLFGSPGNGKTSIAQRICTAFGNEIWLPRALYVDGEIVRVFDPVVHETLPMPGNNEIDHRWVRIKRPTITAGGELTLDNLEMTIVGDSGIVEAPLQLKSNCGVLLIDDFGRQRCSPTDLLNRWIVPLETQVDFLNMPSGKKVRVPFEQMIVFSTNLAPQQLVDEAFLRRIPYKVEAADPDEKEFRRVFQILAEKMSVPFDMDSYKYLVTEHYFAKDRGFRYCHVRDLLTQIKTLCDYHGRDPVMNPKTIDIAVENYFVDYGDYDESANTTCATV